MDDKQSEEEELQEALRRPRDHKIDEAKKYIMSNLFADNNTNVYYGRQLEIMMEKEFFHWITKRALNELVQDRTISFSSEKLRHHVAHFYLPRGQRYVRRQIGSVLKLISEFSQPKFTLALGQVGESLADVGFANSGFRIIQRKVKSVGEKKWTKTMHDLDRIVVRDNVKYGVEIKNQLGYIDHGELRTKIRMCQHFGVKPMFIARMMPKSYIHEVQQAGGFSLILKNQHYPILADDLARKVRRQLGLPVLCIEVLPDTEFMRFETWHEKTRKTPPQPPSEGRLDAFERRLLEGAKNRELE